MRCLSCAERAKLIREAWEAWKADDMELYQEKRKAVLESAAGDVRALLHLPRE